MRRFLSKSSLSHIINNSENNNSTTEDNSSSGKSNNNSMDLKGCNSSQSSINSKDSSSKLSSSSTNESMKIKKSKKYLLKSPLSKKFNKTKRCKGANNDIPIIVPQKKNIEDMNVLEWLQDETPSDILPKVLSYLGPRKMSNLSMVNSTWRNIVLSEPVWRIASEDCGKWSPGDDVPTSWLKFYQMNPCVPDDYDSIESALKAISSLPPKTRNYNANGSKTFRVFIRPGKYFLRRSIVIQAEGSSEVVIEALEPASKKNGYEDSCFITPKKSKKLSVPSPNTLKEMINSCRSSSALETTASSSSNLNTDLDERSKANLLAPTSRAMIVLKTRSHNEPIFRIRQGKLVLKNLDLVHSCNGTDIWNGNAAVQVQPLFEATDHPLESVPSSLRPTAILYKVGITSFSGRGVVNIDGGNMSLIQCHIHHCAATGIYIGGKGSLALLEETDIVNNGNGNILNRRGISRGHSGLYLEQGTTLVRNCNISENALTGISAISTENATIVVENTDLLANATVQLEMPPIDSKSGGRSMSRNNTISGEGSGRSRSGLISSDQADYSHIRSILATQ